MLFGRVFWSFDSDIQKDGVFAARAVIVGEGKEARLGLYQGWAVSDESVRKRKMLTRSGHERADSWIEAIAGLAVADDAWVQRREGFVGNALVSR